MRRLSLIAVLGLLAACGGAPESAEDTEGTSVEQSVVAPKSVKERWCNSFPKSHCPKNVCVWHTAPAPGFCGLPSEI